MSNPSHLLFLLFLLLAGACTADQPSSSVLTKGDENELINRYTTQLVAKPESQAEIDQNIIVNLLIDSLWDFQRTDSGIYYQIQKAKIPSKGHPGLSSFIRAHYRGTLLNGKEFDSSYKRQEPIEFRLSQVIAGWQEVMPLMKKGEKGTFLIPSELAYGPEGFAKMVPPNAVLKFDIHLLNYEDDPDNGF
jgi:hypothetical protein